MRKFARTAMPYINRMKANGVTFTDVQLISAEMETALANLDGISIYGNMGDSWNKGPGKRNFRMVSDGGGPDFGEVMDFSLSDTNGKRTSPYVVTLSKSGHVIRVTRNGTQSETSEQAIDEHQAVALANEWMKRWSDDRLTLVTKEQSTASIQVVYIPIREQVPIP